MPVLPQELKRRSRQMRVRLAGSAVVFFSVLLAVIGVSFYQSLKHILDDTLHDSLDQDWVLLKGVLHLQGDTVLWNYRPSDRDEAFLVERLRRVLLIADEDGEVIEVSDSYLAAGVPSKEALQSIVRSEQATWEIRRLPGGTPLLFRSGWLQNLSGRRYVVSIGRRLEGNEQVLQRFVGVYGLFTPLLVIVAAILSWFLSGEVLQPLRELASTAHSVSSRNLGLRIASREVGDEIDVLIDAFNDLLHRLERSFEQIRRFSTDVSHELRTPITIIRGQLEVALLTARSEAEYREAIQASLAAAERLTNLVQALLMLAEAESGQTALKIEPTKLSFLVEGLRGQFEALAEATGIHWTATVSGEAVMEVDRLQIERMLINLVANAIRYTPKGGAVRLHAAQQPEEVVITVEDTGCGIPPEEMDRIFDRFYRTRTAEVSQRDDGLGLGLSFVDWIVKAHNGRIDVKSEVGKGTRFTVTFPTHQPRPRVDGQVNNRRGQTVAESVKNA